MNDGIDEKEYRQEILGAWADLNTLCGDDNPQYVHYELTPRPHIEWYKMHGVTCPKCIERAYQWTYVDRR